MIPVTQIFFFPISPTQLLTDWTIWVTRWMASKKHELLTPLQASRGHDFTPGFQWGSCYSIFSFMCMFCRSFCFLLSLFFDNFVVSFIGIYILITSLASSNSLNGNESEQIVGLYLFCSWRSNYQERVGIHLTS